MNKKAQFYVNEITCNCGNRISLHSFIGELEDDAFSYYNTSKDEETVTCEKCERKHTVEIEVEIEVSVNCLGIKTTSPITDYKDKECHDIPSTFFNDLVIGSKATNLYDGQYIIEDKELIYEVINEEIVNIFTTKVDENQLTLFV